ncbi:MAG: class I SAM-dependent methyltransferase [Bacteroidales bacterium]|nr:class I SAM-dependent methyltransferase [Bacteroidales bacterium]
MNQDAIKSEISVKWDTEAEYYDTYVSHGVQTESEKKLWTEAFNYVLPQDSRLRILDVGCGTGAMGIILSGTGHDVTGIDLSEKMMDEGRKKAETLRLPMIFQNGDAENPPFEEESFDVVINRHLLWTLPNPDTAIANWYRVLKPGGVLIVIDGQWDDGTLGTQIRRSLSRKIAGIVEKHPHGQTGYTDDIKEALPNIGGLPEGTAVEYISSAGFSDVCSRDLMGIRKNQHNRLPWYKRIAAGDSYYLISGKKAENTL